jgi:hypothetical protein
MTDNARKTSELPTANTIGSSDRLVFLYQANTSTPSTRTITVNSFVNSISISSIKNSNNKSLTVDANGNIELPGGGLVGNYIENTVSNGLDLYGYVDANTVYNFGNVDITSYVSLTYSIDGNASNSNTTGYAYLAGYSNGSSNNYNNISFIVQLPNSNTTLYPSGSAYIEFFSEGNNVGLTWPDGTFQTTAYKISGPYANSTTAAAGGIAINGLYYDSDGNVKIRLT